MTSEENRSYASACGCFPLAHKAKFEFLLHGMAVNFFDLEFYSIKTPFLLDCASYTDQSKVTNYTVILILLRLLTYYHEMHSNLVKLIENQACSLPKTWENVCLGHDALATVKMQVFLTSLINKHVYLISTLSGVIWKKKLFFWKLFGKVEIVYWPFSLRLTPYYATLYSTICFCYDQQWGIDQNCNN